MQNHSRHHHRNATLPVQGFLSWIVLAMLLIVGCKNPTESMKTSEHLTCIATVGGTDTSTQEKVKRILEANDVTPMFEGSVVYGVYVRDAEATRSLQLLKAADSLKGAWIEFQK